MTLPPIGGWASKSRIQLRGAGHEHIRIRATPLLVPTDTAVVLALVVTEPLTNAVKRACGGASGQINVAVGGGPNEVIQIAVADQGTGMRREERPGGAPRRG